MNTSQFKAMVVTETAKGQFERSITQRSTDDLPNGDVLVKVLYSSLNYKDALSATGNKGVTRHFPHTPGIDAAGIVEKSDHSAFKPNDAVIVTSYDLGMNTSGGFGQYIRVPADWVVKMPAGLTAKESMAHGTAGFTAGLSVFELLNQKVTPEEGKILVTGATGGVGCIAVSIMAHLGFEVSAVTGKEQEAAFLQSIGAKEIIPREKAIDSAGRPLMKETWAGVIDTVGGDMLATALKSTKTGGTVTCCGNVASHELNTTVFPFILRGIRLMGVNSQTCPMTIRKNIWDKLADDWKINLDILGQEIKLEELNDKIDQILKGQVKGRVVVSLV